MKVVNYKAVLPVVLDRWYPVSAGSAVFVLSNIEHQFRNTSEKGFSFICLIPSGAPEL